MLGRQAILDGEVDEDTVSAELKLLGWGVVLFGPRVWNDDRCACGRPKLAGDPYVVQAVRDVGGPIAHAPDLMAARGAEIMFVEVVRCAGHVDRCLEVAKVDGAGYWNAVAPYYLVDVADWHVWQWSPKWARDIVEGPTRYTNTGSGDPYAWFTRARDRAFSEVFA